MQSSPLHIMLVVYVIGVVVASWFTHYALRVLRADERDDPERIAVEATIDKFCESTGLRDSGVAVLIGLIWPLALIAYLGKPR